MIPAWLLAETANTTFTRFTRLQLMSEWWHWLLLIVVCALVLGYVIVMYYFDSAELSRGVSATLVLLRLCAFGGILFFFLDLEHRTEQREIKPSRTVMLIDTSQSMSLRDADDRTIDSTSASRMEQVVSEMRDGNMLRQLRDRHEVAVYQFDQEAEPQQIGFFPRRNSDPIAVDLAARTVARQQQQLQVARKTMRLAAGLLILSAVAFLAFWIFGRGPQRRETMSLALLISVLALVAAFVLTATAHLRASELTWRAVCGLEQPDWEEVTAALRIEAAANQTERDPTTAMEPSDVTWRQTLVPRGSKTRLGDTIRSVVTKERGGPLAGIVVISDGGSNAGVDCSVASKSAAAAGIPIFAIGLGSDQQPINVRVVDLEAPKRVFPADKFSLTGFVQAYGLKGRRVNVELFSTTGDRAILDQEDPTANATFEDDRAIQLGDDGEMVPVKFEVTPTEEGVRHYILKVVAPDRDLDSRDDVKSARVKIVERKSRVLLMAGGPMREFRFLRNQLFRDRDTTLDVLLQSGTAGMSQEADQVLSDFPETAEELFEYDCLIAFDFDWMQLDELQVDLLDRFVAQQAGGLIVVAGPVHTPEWAGRRRGRDPRIDTIRGLYPVVFYSQGIPSLDVGRFGGESAWPLQFTRDGLGAEFLWLEDDPIDSEGTWQSFEGVYGYYAVKDPKPGARVYARFSNPATSIDDELPIYLAAHFYGAGRVFFQASGEMWRLRAIDPSYFETYYTKLIRWVSQGRLLRDSNLGVLLVDKDRCLLGDQVTVRAVLSDLQHRPLQLASVPAILVSPDGQRQTLEMRQVQDAARDGMYQTQFRAVMAGDYRVELSPADGNESELLLAEVRVRVPTLEIEHPQRNDKLLLEMTKETGGEYFIGLAAAVHPGQSSRGTLASSIETNDQVIYLPETVDNDFDQRLMGWLMALIIGVLCLEWLLRRLSKLA